MINGNHISEAIDSVNLAIMRVRRHRNNLVVTDEEVQQLKDLVEAVRSYRDNLINYYASQSSNRDAAAAFGMTAARVSQIRKVVNERN